MNEAKRTGKRLKELREIAGLTQFEVAEFLNCDRSLVSMIEGGYHRLNADDAERLTEQLEQKARDRYNSVFSVSEMAVATA